jgi:hypothetical protein
MEYNYLSNRIPSSASSHQITWELGDMNQGEIIEITYDAVPLSDGEDFNHATVFSDEFLP